MRSETGGAADRAGWGQFRSRQALRVSPPREILHTKNHLLRPVLLERTAITMRYPMIGVLVWSWRNRKSFAGSEVRDALS